MKRCCLCNNSLQGYGNNPYPLEKGLCCDNCNTTKVIPARLKLLQPVKLSWMNKLRELKSYGWDAECVLQELEEYGKQEELRVTLDLEKERLKIKNDEKHQENENERTK